VSYLASVCWYCHKQQCACRSPTLFERLMRRQTFVRCTGCRACKGPPFATQAEIDEWFAKLGKVEVDA
jgi:hypothetical protein